MTSKIGVNLRVTDHSSRGQRTHMEDVFSVAYEQDARGDRLEFACFAIFDGHGGREAALFAKDHLMDCITQERGFWSDHDRHVLQAIRQGFLRTQDLMLREAKQKWPKQAPWPRAGTTASIAFIKRGKLFVGHCGDSAIVLGLDKDGNSWKAQRLTKEHKPEDPDELARIKRCGGRVMAARGVQRVAWSRPASVDAPDQIVHSPILSVARSLGDFWSYNADSKAYIVSPEPDVHVFDLDPMIHRCLVFATDGVWNVLSEEHVVEQVCMAERNNSELVVKKADNAIKESKPWLNPSKRVVEEAEKEWRARSRRADNATVVTVFLDPPGDSRESVLRRLHGLKAKTTTRGRPDEPAIVKGSSFMARGPTKAKHGTAGKVGCDGDNKECSKVKRIVSDSEINKLQLILVPRPLSSLSPPPLPPKPLRATSKQEKGVSVANIENCDPLQKSTRTSRRSLPKVEPKVPTIAKKKLVHNSPSPPPVPRKSRRSAPAKTSNYPRPPCVPVSNTWLRPCVILNTCPVHSKRLQCSAHQVLSGGEVRHTDSLTRLSSRNLRHQLHP